MGVVLNKNIRACNPLHPPPPARSLVETVMFIGIMVTLPSDIFFMLQPQLKET